MAVLIERCVLMSRAATLDCFSRSVPHLHTDRANNTQNERAGDSGRRGGECARGTPVGCGWARSGPSFAPRSPDARVGIDAPTHFLYCAHRSPRRLCARALQRDICVDRQRCGFRRRGRAGVQGDWCAAQTYALKGDRHAHDKLRSPPSRSVRPQSVPRCRRRITKEGILAAFHLKRVPPLPVYLQTSCDDALPAAWPARAGMGSGQSRVLRPRQGPPPHCAPASAPAMAQHASTGIPQALLRLLDDLHMTRRAQAVCVRVCQRKNAAFGTSPTCQIACRPTRSEQHGPGGLGHARRSPTTRPPPLQRHHLVTYRRRCLHRQSSGSPWLLPRHFSHCRDPPRGRSLRSLQRSPKKKLRSLVRPPLLQLQHHTVCCSPEARRGCAAARASLRPTSLCHPEV